MRRGYLRKVLAVLGISAGLSGPAAALDYCEDAWLTRNLIIDRYGYCFNSGLGQALFDNSDCSTSQPALSAQDTELVTRIREGEAQVGCSINTGAGPSPAMREAHAFYNSLQDIPAADHLGWACWGYHGAPMPIRSGASDTAPVIGTLQPGQGMVSEYWPRGAFIFATIVTGPSGAVLGQGWMRAGITDADCDQVAG
jgi:hypothetical protein